MTCQLHCLHSNYSFLHLQLWNSAAPKIALQFVWKDMYEIHVIIYELTVKLRAKDKNSEHLNLNNIYDR
jgi:hypothetical protein